MLRDATAFSSFTVDDVARTKEFYLGAGTRVGIYPKPDHVPATFTILTPEVHPVAWFRDPAGNILSIVQE